MKKYTTLLFDADNTLLDFDACEKEALKKTFEAYNCPLRDDMKKRYMEINHALWKSYEKGEISREEVIYTRFGKLFEEFGISLDGVEFEDTYQDELGKSHELVEHAMDVILQLKQYHDLYIVTNGVSATQYSRLKDSGLDQHFKYIFISEEVGYRKPMKEYFSYCFDKIGDLDKEKTLIIGDSLSSDIKGGNNAGIATCWYNPKKQKKSDDYHVTHEIEDLRELLELV